MVTFGEVLGAAGYQTALSGKWHLGATNTTHPFHRGFQEFYGLLDGACNHFDPARPDPEYKGGGVRRFGHNDEFVTTFPENFYSSDAFTDHAITTLRRFATNSSPFFLHLCFTAPHYPLHAKPTDIAKYKGTFKMGWEAMRRGRFERQLAMGLFDPATCKLSQGDSHAYDWNTANTEFEDLRMAVYAAMVDCVDQNIGRLLQALQEVGAAENTIIFFLSDNGGCAEEPGGRDPTQRNPGPKEDYVAVGPAWGWAQNAPFRRYKAFTHEGGICTPMIAWYPKMIHPSSITRAPAHIIDFMPTLIDLAETTYPQQFKGHDILPLEGRSLLPLLKSEDKSQHEFLAWEWAGSRAYRRGDWKVVWDREVKAWELYDLASDRTEIVNRAQDKPELTAELSEAWFAWAERTGAPGKRQPSPTAP
jgi:arylsulfatase